jgi:uncharacterized protein
MPHRTGVPLEWRLKKGRFGLFGAECDCGELFFPQRDICNKCGSVTKEKKFSGLGVVETFTIISAAPAGFEEYSPYTVAIIKLDEGPKISSQVVNPEEIKVGSRVVPIFRKISDGGHSGIINYGLKFEIVV